MSTFFETLTVNDAYLANNKRPRQRITRACDQCHELRTRCNGEKPCNRCNELSVACAYDRRPKKRGKASWRRSASPTQGDRRSQAPELAQQASGAASNSVQPVESDRETDQAGTSRSARERSNTLSGSVTTPDNQQTPSYETANADASANPTIDHQELQSQTALPSLDRGEFLMTGGIPPRPANSSMLHASNSFKLPQQRAPEDLEYHSLSSPGNISAFGAGMPSPHGSEAFESFLQGNTFSGSTSFPRNNLPWQPAQQSPRPFNFDSDHGSLIAADMKMKYSVLSPLMPHLINVISLSLGNELLEYYFSTFTGSSTHPLSPYIPTFILRKNSVLHPSNPRRCSPALLCSMLWLAAQTSEATALTDGPTSRVRITHKLLELTLDLLKPLRHQPEGRSGQRDTRDDETSREFLHVSPNGNVPRTIEAKNFGRSGSIDNIITYIHLGTVFSASEHKATSIRWWSVAWSMARDMKLNKEVPYPDVSKNDEDIRMGSQAEQHGNSPPSTNTSEEEREERRRVWWLLYMCDRHLSLCYNQPLFLTDVECETLMQPLDERVWRHARSDELEQLLLNYNGRPRGPQTVCHNLSLFGYFLPLMTILGAIADLRSARNHPRFGEYARSSPFWDELAADISRQLDDYHYSLKQLGGGHAAVETAEDALQQRIAVAYGTHIMHVMHILLNGKWDPIDLLDDEDHWVSSASFRKATKHATSAAEVIPSIFDNDLDLSFMPWYWGIYLLQGSFLLLFVADKLQTQLAPSVLGALQSIVRAHEACAVTLDNEYQRNFRKIMISAVGQIKGRVAEDSFLQQQKRREALSLYRWNGGGGGLAL